MKALLLTLGVALPTMCIADNPVAASRACQAKYGEPTPVGGTAPKADPTIRINPQQFDRVPGYACLVVTVDDSGRLVDARVAETDHASLAQHLLNQVSSAHWQPAMRDGAPIELRFVISASYGGTP